jgi:hypothetical protein
MPLSRQELLRISTVLSLSIRSLGRLSDAFIPGEEPDWDNVLAQVTRSIRWLEEVKRMVLESEPQ